MDEMSDRLLDQLTRRLGDDPELQLEVRRELAVHLEDSAAEYGEAGHGEREAMALAVKALGPADELAEQLYRANRGRMRWRGVWRRVALTLLVPAAVLVTVWPLAGAWMSQRDAASLIGDESAVDLALGLFGETMAAKIGALPEEERFLFRGKDGDDRPWKVARSVTERWPEDSVAQGDYVVSLMLATDTAMGDVRLRMKDDRRIDRGEIAMLLGEIDRGRAIEPDNAWYDFLKASMLMYVSSTMTIDAGPKVRSFERVRFDEDVNQVKPVEKQLDDLVIADRVTFGEAMSAFEAGLRKPYMTSHVLHMHRRRFESLGQPASVKELVSRVTAAISILLPDLSHFRSLSRRIQLHAIALADAGQGDEAMKLADALEVMGTKMAIRSGTLIDLLVARMIETLSLETRVAVLDRTGRSREADAGLVKYGEVIQWHQRAQGEYGQIDQSFIRECGMLMRVVMPAIPGYRPDPEPLRSAEYALYQKVMIAWMLAAVDLAAVLMWIAGMWIVFRERRQERKTPMVWLGWRKLGWMVLWSVIVPTAVYAGYTQTPVGGRQWGLWVSGTRLSIEHASLFVLMVVLMWMLTGRALRQRVEGLGLGNPAARQARSRRRAVMVRLIVGGVLLVVGVPLLMVDLPVLLVGLALWGMVEVILIVMRWVIPLLFGSTETSRVKVRSMSPVLAMVVIVSGVIGYSVTSALERSAIHRAGGDTGLGLVAHEIEDSAYRLMRDEMVKRHGEVVGEFR